MSSSTRTEFCSPSCLLNRIASNEEPLIRLECLFTKVSPLNVKPTIMQTLKSEFEIPHAKMNPITVLRLIL